MSCQARVDAALQYPRSLGWNILKFSSWNLYSLEIPVKNEKSVLCFKVSSGPGKWNVKIKTQIFKEKKALLVCWRQKQVRMQHDDDREPGPHLGTHSTQAFQPHLKGDCEPCDVDNSRTEGAAVRLCPPAAVGGTVALGLLFLSSQLCVVAFWPPGFGHSPTISSLLTKELGWEGKLGPEKFFWNFFWRQA